MRSHLLLISLFLLTANFLLVEVNAAENKEKPATEKTEPQKEKSKSDNHKIPLPSPLIKQQKQDLTHYIAKEKISPILAGPNDYLTIINKYTSASNKGVAILLPDWQQGATNPKAINYLSKALPNHGWTTIAIQPDNKPDNYPSRATVLSEQKEENKKTIEDYQIKLSAMMSALMKKAQEYPGIVIVIAQGNNAALLVDLYDKEKNKPANALLMLSSFRKSNIGLNSSVNEVFATQVATSEYPTLDLYLKNDHPLTINNAKLRHSLAQQEMKVYYRQRQLNNTVSGYYPEQELLTQINSWLNAIGW